MISIFRAADEYNTPGFCSNILSISCPNIFKEKLYFHPAQKFWTIGRNSSKSLSLRVAANKVNPCSIFPGVSAECLKGWKKGFFQGFDPSGKSKLLFSRKVGRTRPFHFQGHMRHLFSFGDVLLKKKREKKRYLQESVLSRIFSGIMTTLHPPSRRNGGWGEWQSLESGFLVVSSVRASPQQSF